MSRFQFRRYVSRRRDISYFLAAPAALLALAAGLSACGKFVPAERPPVVPPAAATGAPAPAPAAPSNPSPSADPKKAAEENKEKAKVSKKEEEEQQAALDKAMELFAKDVEQYHRDGVNITPPDAGAGGVEPAANPELYAKKVAFVIEIASPLLEWNRSIVSQRTRLEGIASKMQKSKTTDPTKANLSPTDLQALYELRTEYAVSDSESIEALLAKVDVVPLSVLGAIVAQKTDWGQKQAEGSLQYLTSEKVKALNTAPSPNAQNFRKVRAESRLNSSPTSAVDMLTAFVGGPSSVYNVDLKTVTLPIQLEILAIINDDPSFKSAWESGFGLDSKK